MSPIRRNIAHLTPAEREHFVDVIRQVDLLSYSDGVSYWDKQDQIHQVTHNHGGNSFLPWHRELCNRFEKLLQQVDPDVALHYWDWTEDPRAADDGQGGTVNLFSPTLFGTDDGLMDGPLSPLHNGGELTGSREDTGDPADPPQSVTRGVAAGAPGMLDDASLLASADALPQADQWAQIRTAIEGQHNSAHGYIGGDIGGQHGAFEDPFVFLLHSNVDRLFAMWQVAPGEDWRLHPDQVYGSESTTADSQGILYDFQPWNGTVEFGAPIEPWTGASPLIEHKNSRHPSVVRPPCYDTLPLTVEQVAPSPPQPVRFLDVVEQLPTARAVRLRVRGCQQITANATITGPFTLLSPSVTSPAVEGFENVDVLIWVLFEPGSAPDTANGQVTIDVPETGDTFVVDIQANVVANPTVASSLVLDRSGSMDLPSGVATKTRLQVLKESAPLFVHLLDSDDGIGIVAFDTDADEVEPVQPSGPQIGGAGRAAALAAIGGHATDPLGLTAIGDGIEEAVTQLTPVTASFDDSAIVVFTDGHETAPKTIAQVADSVGSRVFAVGLGTAEQLNPVALSDIANGTGGFLLLTGNPGADDTILLQKYFAQVLAGVTNAAIIVDPDGFVPVGGETVVPFDVTAADRRLDVIVLSPASEAIDVILEAPGTQISAGNGAEEVVTETYRLLRTTAIDPDTVAGTWQARLRVNRQGLQRWISTLEELGRDRELVRLKAHGLPFTLSVQARSALRLGVAIAQPSRRPGSVATVTATLAHSGVPLANTAAVDLHLTRPDGSHAILAAVEVDAGVFNADVPTATSGVHRLLVRARGADLHGRAFTREELRTLAVWPRGDDPAPTIPGAVADGDRVGWCELLRCWLDDDRVGRFLEKRGLSAKGLAACLRRACG